MHSEIDQIIDQAMKVELQVAKLYALFARVTEAHRQFWWELSEEERRHGAIFRNFKIELTAHRLPGLPKNMNLAHFEDMNRQLASIIEEVKTELPDPCRCFELAIEVESLNAEYYIEQLTDGTHDQLPFVRIITRLIEDDRDHMRRIKKRMAQFC